MTRMPFFWRDKYVNDKGKLAVPGMKLEPKEITIVLIRDRFSALTTQGKLNVAGKIYDTLEPPDRDEKPRCIPPGKYSIVMEWSPKFKRVLPELKGVPDFTEVKLHKGNYPQNTAGCILVGMYSTEDTIHDSQNALEEILDVLNGYQSIWIEIIDSRRQNENPEN